ncbi:MAG: XTP/dITP diphosphatase [Methanosarcinaceae archaeon]|nr:XTP/dITP diphosphatase [Methanosarcinaceae archaeon]NKQ39146.1 XTP/dITP diphosphatase [Methanosarcinales archaeon]
MKKIVFVTGNYNKFIEVRDIFAKKGISVIQKKEDYPEIQSNSLEEIAEYGVQYLVKKLNKAVMMDDTGLFIEVLNGFPGPYSAFVDKCIGNKKILKLMEGELNRNALFKTVVGYCEPNNEPILSVGIVKGKIADKERGLHGFGYDPIFEYDGKTFGEMAEEDKNEISHRRMALNEFLKLVG